MSRDELCFLTMAEAGRLLKAHKVSPVDLTEAYLSRIDAMDSLVNSYVTVAADHARRQARAAEAEISAGRYRGPLHGIPYALKDIIDTKGILTTACSRIDADRIPTEDAFAVAKLNDAGAILLGKLTCQEFATTGIGFDLPWPPAKNPWNPAHTTGGSSSGSGAAVAAGLAMGALGTDTGGSIRNPSALCGLAGLKPTYGRVSRRGVAANSWSLDHIGPMTWTVEDSALMLGAIAGFDPEDPGSADAPVPDFTAGLESGLKGVRIGWVRHFYEEDLPANDEVIAAMTASADQLRALGATVEEMRLPSLREYANPRHIIGAAELYAFHEESFQTRYNDYGVNVRQRGAVGGLIRAVDYIQAQRCRLALTRTTNKIFEHYDALLTANHYGPAGLLATTKTRAVDSLSVTGVFNLTGHPALAVCNGFSKCGLPLSMQIVADQFDEATALRVGYAYEQATPWRKTRPSLEIKADA